MATSKSKHTRKKHQFKMRAKRRTDRQRKAAQAAKPTGYILAASQNIQADVPPENVVEMFAAAKKWGRYPMHPPL